MSGAVKLCLSLSNAKFEDTLVTKQAIAIESSFLFWTSNGLSHLIWYCINVPITPERISPIPPQRFRLPGYATKTASVPSVIKSIGPFRTTMQFKSLATSEAC